MHDWRMPDGPAFGARATTGDVTQRRCLRCLLWDNGRVPRLCGGRLTRYLIGADR